MANTDSTQSAVSTGFKASQQGLCGMPELEKISCSIKGKTFIHPLELMGKRIRFAETVLLEVGLFEGDALVSDIDCGTVLAVNLGSIEHGIETSLLLQDVHGNDPYYTDIAKLTVLEVLQ